MQVTVSFIDIAVIVVSTGLIIWWALKRQKRRFQVILSGGTQYVPG